ncbi:MAG: SPOUT family RNA methylase [Candidatus Bathyarchaeia archaeon]
MCGFQFPMASVIIKTLKGYEAVVAQLVKENFPNVDVLASPFGYSGLVLVAATDENPKELAEKIKLNLPEAEKVFPIMKYTSACMDSLCEASIELAGLLSDAKNFAVHTVRRGKHNFRSLDVNIKVGAALKSATGLPVNLDSPDRVFFVEIINEHAYLGVVDGREFPKKMTSEKIQVRPYFRKVSLVQMPYLGGLEASKEMGTRIGREAQTFEVGELVIAPIGIVKADEFLSFVHGVFEGIESRYNIQLRTYAEKPCKTEVYVQNLYELVRQRSSEPIVVFEPEGEPINRVAGELAELTINAKRVSFLIGSREGVPHGIFRFARMTIDLCPGVTISTDLAAASALTALAFALHDKLSGKNEP